MNKIEESFLRHCLKPSVTCNLPGRLRLAFAKYQLLPKEALPYLHYVRDVLLLLPGVTDAQANPRIGTVLVSYDPGKTSEQTILQWVATVVDEGIQLSREDIWQGADEQTLAALVRERLLLRLPK